MENRFIVGAKGTVKQAKADAKAIEALSGRLISAVLLSSEAVALSLAVTARWVCDFAKGAPFAAVLSAAVMLDFAAAVALSAGIGSAVIIARTGTLTIGDIKPAVASALPSVGIVCFALATATVAWSVTDGIIRLAVISAIAVTTAKETKRMLFFPCVMLFYRTSVREAVRISAKVCKADSEIVNRLYSQAVDAVILSLIFPVIGTVTAKKRAVCLYSALADIILPDYQILLNKEKTKGASKWQTRKSSI